MNKPYLQEQWEEENMELDPFKVVQFILMLLSIVALIKYIF